MPRPVPQCEPTSFAANETAQWTRAFGDFPAADGWTLRYYFRGPDTFDVVADGSGSAWLVTVKPGDTQGKAAGLYRWTAFAERGAAATLERYSVATGLLTLTPDLTTAAAGALQSFEEQALPIVEAALKGTLTKAQAAFTINGTAVTKFSPAELERLRVKYRKAIRLRRGRGKLPAVEVRFVRA